MRGSGRLARALAPLLIAALIPSCGSVTAPPGPDPGTMADYSTPGQTLLTLARGIADKGGIGAEAAYLGGFADSTAPGTPDYHHDFDPVDVAFYENACGCAVPSRWGVARERVFYQTFLNVRPRHAYATVFEPVAAYPDPPPSGGSARLYRHYAVTATSPGGDSTLVIVVGFADLAFSRVADRWVITRWTDHPDPDAVIDPLEPEQVTFGRRRLYSTY